MRPLRMFLLLAAIALAPPALAQTLYKLVDKTGKVTYTSEAPKDFNGTVTRIDVDPNANTATMPKFVPPAATAPSAPGKAAASGEKAATPQEKLERARKALADAIANPGPEDVRRVGNAGGGTRPVFSDDYAKRIAELERGVKEAEDEVRRAGR